MTEVFVGVGSNIDAVRNTRFALAEIRDRFTDVRVSRIYESAPVGFDGDNFLNLVVRFTTDLGVKELVEMLRRIEDCSGRVRTNVNGSGKEFVSRTLDLDLLIYGDRVGNIDGVELPRSEITRYAHVLVPLAELAGGRLHPGVNKTYSDLSRAFDPAEQQLKPLDLDNQDTPK